MNPAFSPEPVAHGFLGPERRLFAHFHAPSSPARGRGYLVCAPVGYEGVHCHTTVRHLAVQLAAAGFPTLRIEYDGTGESVGSDADPDRVGAWRASVHHAVQALRATAGIREVAVVGIRMGATLAGLAAAETPVAGLVLWEPCVSGALYARELEIVAAAAVTGPASDRPDGSVHAGGYLYTAETLRDLRGIDLQEAVPVGSPPVLLLSRDDRPPHAQLAARLEAAGCAVTAEQPPGHREMMAGGHAGESRIAVEIVERIVAWAREHAPAPSGGEAVGTPVMAPETSGGGVRRRVVRFGPDDRLFGILTERAAAEGADRAPVVLVTAGILPRTGANRMYVSLADRLAGRGHRVLRFDVSGIAETPAAESAPLDEPFARTLLDDVRAALGVVGDGSRRSWVIGLCSGGAAAYRTAVEGASLAGAIAINPPVFDWDPHGAADAPSVKDVAEAQYYRQALFRWSSWRRLLTGRAHFGHIITLVAGRVASLGRGLWHRALARVGLRSAGGLEREIGDTLARGVKVHLVYAAGDPSHEVFRHLAGAAQDRLEARGLGVHLFAGTDHTFGPFAARESLMEWIAATVGEPPQERG